MTADEVEFVKHVCENPADDTPRLAYADWLDENAGTVPCGKCTPNFQTASGNGLGWLLAGGSGHGDPYFHIGCETCGGDGLVHELEATGREGSGTVPDGRAERAELIRVQCELAAKWEAKGSTFGSIGGGKRLAELRDREKTLLTTYWKTWAPGGFFWFCKNLRDDADVAGRSAVLFRRGFVSELACSSSDWLARGDGLHWHRKATDECPDCNHKRTAYFHAGIRCPTCKDGRVPRPVTRATQPVEAVELTTDPCVFGAWTRGPLRNAATPALTFDLEHDRWPGIVFRWRQPTATYTTGGAVVHTDHT